MISYSGRSQFECPGGQFYNVCRGPDHRTETKRPDRTHQVYYSTVTAEEKDINRESHPDRVNCLFAAQNEAFAGAERSVPQKAPHARPCAGGYRPLFHKHRAASEVDRAHLLFGAKARGRENQQSRSQKHDEKRREDQKDQREHHFDRCLRGLFFRPLAALDAHLFRLDP